MSGDCLIVIPARMGSTRFPGKPLADLAGRPVLWWCWRAAAASGAGGVVVATDHPAIEAALRQAGAAVERTSPRCPSGSDRVWRAAGKRMTPRTRFVVNLQGDEPLIRPGTIRRVVEALRRDPAADIATAVVPAGPREAARPDVVKAVRAAGGRCLYFSRAAVPASPPGSRRPGYYRHIGIYAFRREALRRFVGLRPSPLERRERLEQLRALEAGMSVTSVVVRDPAVAIDRPSDLARARALLRRAGLRRAGRRSPAAAGAEGRG